MSSKIPATSPLDVGPKLLSAAASPDYCRMAAARAKAVQAMITTPSLRLYLDKIITLFEGRAVEFEGPEKA